MLRETASYSRLCAGSILAHHRPVSHLYRRTTRRGVTHVTPLHIGCLIALRVVLHSLSHWRRYGVQNQPRRRQLFNSADIYPEHCLCIGNLVYSLYLSSNGISCHSRALNLTDPALNAWRHSLRPVRAKIITRLFNQFRMASQPSQTPPLSKCSSC